MEKDELWLVRKHVKWIDPRWRFDRFLYRRSTHIFPPHSPLLICFVLFFMVRVGKETHPQTHLQMFCTKTKTWAKFYVNSTLVIFQKERKCTWSTLMNYKYSILFSIVNWLCFGFKCITGQFVIELRLYSLFSNTSHRIKKLFFFIYIILKYIYIHKYGFASMWRMLAREHACFLGHSYLGK